MASWILTCEYCGKQKQLRFHRKQRFCSHSCASFTHGHSTSPEYISWEAMKQRCFDPKKPNYHLYGGRGITVCERWMDFRNFLADMGPRPSPAHSLDRFPDRDGNYEPGNVRWATGEQQANNTRTNRHITFHEETLTLAQWARRLDIGEGTLRWRLKAGWSIERAFSTPLRRH